MAFGLTEGKDTVFALLHTFCGVNERLSDQVQLEFWT